jgi:EpsD family peptidyl-prolyl cis-trans isomerase
MAWTALPLALALAGCQRVGGDTTQVAARVNDTEISLAQLQHIAQRQPSVTPQLADSAARRVLDSVIDQEIAAQGARKQGLDRDPRVVQAMEAAKRETLARAFQDAIAEKAPLPSSDEVDRYYDSQPALFAQRRFYVLQEIHVQGSHEAIAPLQKRVEATPDAAAAVEVLREAKLQYSSRQLTVSPEDVPLLLVGKLSEMRPGRSMMLAQPGGARVLTLLSSTPAPLSREAARPTIQAYLTNERRRRAVAEAMKSLHDESRIEYKGKFAQVASAATAAASGVARP